MKEINFKRLRHLLSITFIIIMTFSLVACGTGSDSDDDTTPVSGVQVSGNAYTQPQASTQAILNLNVSEVSLSTSELFYTFETIALLNVSVIDISKSSNAVTIIGVGTIDNSPGYKFTVTIIDGNPDEMGISINDPSDNLFHDLGINEVVSSSDYTIVN